jgi:hypothetical protein
VTPIAASARPHRSVFVVTAPILRAACPRDARQGMGLAGVSRCGQPHRAGPARS